MDALFDQTALTDLAERLVAAARRAGADAADAIATRGISQSVEVRDGTVEESERSEGDDLGLRVFVGHKQAVVSTNDLSGANADALAERAEAARKTADDPRIDISCLEAVIGTRYTVYTIIHLRRRVSGVRFVWIMGADNLAQFHRWKDWRRIAAEVPIAVIDRPPQSFRALAAPAAQALARYRLPENDATSLPDQRPPAWVFLSGLKLNLSSTVLRNPDGSWRTNKQHS